MHLEFGRPSLNKTQLTNGVEFQEADIILLILQGYPVRTSYVLKRAFKYKAPEPVDIVTDHEENLFDLFRKFEAGGNDRFLTTKSVIPIDGRHGITP